MSILTKILLIHCLLHVNLPCFLSTNLNPICDEQNNGAKIVTNLSPDICAQYNLTYEHKGDTDCYSKCYKPAEETCSKNKKCRPGWICETDKCVIDETSCLGIQQKITSDKLWKPECLLNGEWKPMQCKGELGNGRCFCYDAEGNRIFGQEWSDKAKNMTCACSRQRAELLKQGRKDVTLHCDSMGNYEPLQCDSGLCWCAEPKTGQILSTIVTDEMMKFLPCYKKEKIGEQYLRQCESQLYGQAKILQEFKLHGTQESSFQFALCDWDGTYGKYTVERNVAYCTLKDNTHVGSWAQQVTANMEKTLNCNCARDQVVYKEAGLSFNLICQGNGNYEPVQISTDGKFYCVDSDGFPTTLPVEHIDANDCPKYYK